MQPRALPLWTFQLEHASETDQQSGQLNAHSAHECNSDRVRERERRWQPVACMTESKLILYCNCITTEARCYGKFPLVVVVAVFGSCCCSVRLTADQHTQFGSWKPLIDFVFRVYLLVIQMQYVFTYIYILCCV